MSVRYYCTNFSLHKVLNSNLANICPRKVPPGDRKGIARAPEAPPSLPPSLTFNFFAWQTGDVWPRRRRIP